MPNKAGEIPCAPFLYVIIDGREGILEKLRGIIKAGVEIVQLRDKNLSTKELISLGQKIGKIIINKVSFFINDRFDISLAVRAQGVHLGQDDLPVRVVREVVGKRLRVGLSTHTLKELKKSKTQPVDYVSFGPIFKTSTKTDALSPRGIDKLKEAVSPSKHTVVAVGGIKKDKVREILKTGASGVAISRAILEARDTYQATLEIRKEMGL